MTPLYHRAKDKWTTKTSCLSCREVKSDEEEDKEVGKKKKKKKKEVKTRPTPAVVQSPLKPKANTGYVSINNSTAISKK